MMTDSLHDNLGHMTTSPASPRNFVPPPLPLSEVPTVVLGLTAPKVSKAEKLLSEDLLKGVCGDDDDPGCESHGRNDEEMMLDECRALKENKENVLPTKAPQ